MSEDSNKTMIEEYLLHQLTFEGVVYKPNGRAYDSTAALVLEHGRDFRLGEPPTVEEKMPFGECYKNAFNLAEYNDELTYVEGFASEPLCGIPLQHAWVVDRHGVVIDFTWDTQGDEYFGIPLTVEYVREQLVLTEVWGAFTYDSEALEKGLSKEAIEVKETWQD
jgi:hypothetical protein